MTVPLFELDRPRREFAPGAVHVPGWLSSEQQHFIVQQYRQWAAGPVPPHSARLPGGGRMSVESLSLGWHWLPYRYSKVAEDVNGRAVLDFPLWLRRAAQSAVRAAYFDSNFRSMLEGAYTPDSALANFYRSEAKMGLHQDKQEQSSNPVVSLSIGDSCTFRFCTTERRGAPYVDLTVESGDLIVFGGPSRWAYHGVPTLHPSTAPHGCALSSGRLNLTVRQTLSAAVKELPSRVDWA